MGGQGGDVLMFLIYTRVSTEEQAQDNRTSLEQQERICRGIAQARGLAEFDIEVYRDKGVSGSTPLCQRPSGKDLLDSIRPADIVVATKLDRLFRSAVDALQVAEIFKEKGAHLILPEFGLEPVTGNGAAKLFFTILSGVAEFERDMIRERMVTGKKGKKGRGGHAGGEAPYGYKIVGQGRDSVLVKDEAEQQVVALVKKLLRQGAEIKHIRQEILAAGFKTRTGKEFQRTQVLRIVEKAA